MKVIDIIERAKNPLVSYEIIPPKRGGTIQQIFELIEPLQKFNPPFIDVTSHAAEVQYEELANGVVKRTVKRKRPGTLGMCAAIKGKFGIETVPHLLCEGFTREETEDALIELNYLGIQNVLALRGDQHGFSKPIATNRSRNDFASDLVKQITAMNRGEYLEEMLDAAGTDFCIGVAGYPEKHFESPNMQRDIHYLKQKVDAGAAYIVTQMFFDNRHFFTFVETCRAAGITVPIIPGLKVLTTKNHLKSLPKSFYLELPEELVQEIEQAPKERVPEIGMKWAIKQAEELLSNGYNVHFYIMQQAKHIVPVVEALYKMA
ncbi:MAG: methylenetetrahydrofolate reductase [Rhodothermia bacterium]|nr:methylenetetrahydrofolate reductase [Rhodothermia bacterium]